MKNSQICKYVFNGVILVLNSIIENFYTELSLVLINVLETNEYISSESIKEHYF